MQAGKMEHIKDNEGNLIAIIYKTNLQKGPVVINFPYDVRNIVLFDDYLNIHINRNLNGLTAGLCGTYNGHQNTLFEGPKQCLYNNGESRFRDAWTVDAHEIDDEHCTSDKYSSLKAEVKNYQKSCSKQENLDVTGIYACK